MEISTTNAGTGANQQGISSPSGATPKQSSTEILLKKCVEVGEISAQEAELIIAHWLASPNANLEQRSKKLYHYIKQNFGTRAQPIWESMSNQHQKMLNAEKDARAKLAQSGTENSKDRPATADTSNAAQVTSSVAESKPLEAASVGEIHATGNSAPAPTGTGSTTVRTGLTLSLGKGLSASIRSTQSQPNLSTLSPISAAAQAQAQVRTAAAGQKPTVTTGAPVTSAHGAATTIPTAAQSAAIAPTAPATSGVPASAPAAPVYTNPLEELIHYDSAGKQLEFIGRGTVAQDLTSDLAAPEAEAEKRLRYSSLGSVAAMNRSDDERAAVAGALHVTSAPVASDLTWATENIVDKFMLKTLQGYLEQLAHLSPSAEACKLLSKAVQQQACKLLAQGIQQNNRRHSRAAFDDFGLLTYLNDGNRNTANTNNSNHVNTQATVPMNLFRMGWGPDVYGAVTREEDRWKRLIVTAATEATEAIKQEKATYEARCKELDIPLPGAAGGSASNVGAKRKLSAVQAQNQSTIPSPWWVTAAEKEKTGQLNWQELAHLYFAQQVVNANNATGTMDPTKRPRIDGTTTTATSSSTAHVMNQTASHTTAPVNTVTQKLAQLRASCPLVGPVELPTSSSILIAKDFVNCISDAVTAQAGNRTGYGDRLGRSIQREKLLPKVSTAESVTYQQAKK